MPGRANQVDQMAAMARVIEAAPHAVEVRAHLRNIVESPAFKGSRRSQEFLHFIVEHALDHRFEDLKERTLGVELFGRAPSYDTGDDAIVRVTACDVRNRLNQFYSEFGFDSEFRVELPPGSYIPEFRQTGNSRIRAAVTTSVAHLEMPAADPEPLPETGHHHTPGIRTGIAALVALASLGAALWFWSEGRSADARSSPIHLLPWSAMVQPNRQTHVIFCDPEIVTVQRLLNYSVTLSDYANQHYWPAPAEMKPDARRIMQSVSFRGATVAAVDAAIGLRIDNLIAPFGGRQMEMHTARNVRLGDFKTEDAFILLGSPRSNPWVELFQDQLDFRFEFDSVRKAEFLRNKHPQTGEPAAYVPTAEGWGTGQAYGIVALVGNPGQNGRVLLMAGSNAEATEAAGKVATNPELLSRVLRSHGIDPAGPARNFEVLLRVSTMAGSPNTSEVIACHLLKAGNAPS